MTGRRSAAEVAVLFRRLGRDLQLGWAGPAGSFTDGDLAPAPRRELGRPGPVTDLAVADDVDQAVQLLVTRLMTRRGELAPLGHADYGSRHHELVGEPNTERTRNLVKVHVLEALRHEPRVAKVLSCHVDGGDGGAGSRPRDVVRVVLLVRLIDSAEPLNLVLPVELAG